MDNNRGALINLRSCPMMGVGQRSSAINLSRKRPIDERSADERPTDKGPADERQADEGLADE